VSVQFARSDATLHLRAAQYVRMSTDHQQYSTENQAATIAAYAAQRNLRIVREYADEGRSGLRMEGRDALQRLIQDVQSGQIDFRIVLVYDVSRWGRFQDADESAYYEFICKRAGIQVLYCAENFENDGSLFSTMFKNMKRAMAAEFSRELSTKVFAGSCNLVRRGFWQGAKPGYGFRRALIGADGTPKGLLAFGERKSIQSDRVILVPGPAEEVATVHRIYRDFVTERKSTLTIARELNQEGVPNGAQGSWGSASVRKILTNEKYVGTNVYNRVSRKLRGDFVRNDPAAWIRVKNAFEGLVEPATFAAAVQLNELHRQTICERMSTEEMLRLLGLLFKERGRLSRRMINKAPDVPRADYYMRRFGTLARAYEQVGYHLETNYDYVESRRSLVGFIASIVTEIITEIERSGLGVIADTTSKAFVINGKFSLAIHVIRCRHCRNRSPEWLLQSRRGIQSEHIAAVRMDQANRAVLDYFLIPTREMNKHRISLGMNPCQPYRLRSRAALIDAIKARSEPNAPRLQG
jgi:DNA invertase Pin-like site-specific DNA recombinase